MPPEIQTKTSSDNEKKALRVAEAEKKRAELQRRMEEASKSNKGKKSFLTKERKKRLRLLLRKKAAEELKKEQERGAEVRKLTIDERCGKPEDIEWAGKEELIDVCEIYYQRMLQLESEKWDIERDIRRKHFEISDMNGQVNDLRGKFIKPPLKKISKYGNKFAQLQRKAAEFNRKNQLKLVRRHEVKEDDKKNQQTDNNPENEEIKETEGEERKNEEPSEVEEGTSAKEGEEDPLKISDGTSDVQTSLEHDSESRLEDGTEAVSHGEEGIQNEESRLDMPELSKEEVQPPEQTPSIHTEEDLWMYLRDNVSAVHPSTVEEFVQILIDTLQRVPEECLKPVIEANDTLQGVPEEGLKPVIEANDTLQGVPEEGLKPVIEANDTLQGVPEEGLKPVIEANISSVETPSVTDGEPLTTPVEEEANKVEPPEGDNLDSVAPQDTQETSEGILTSATEEVLSQVPGDSSTLEDVSEPQAGIP